MQSNSIECTRRNVQLITHRLFQVNTAISFLQNPAVARSSIVQKQNFLRSKGLTDDEIQIACDRAGVFSGERNSNTVINMGISHTPAVAAVATTQSHGVLSLLHKVREVLSSTAVLAGLVYAIYVVYKVRVTRFMLKYV